MEYPIESFGSGAPIFKNRPSSIGLISESGVVNAHHAHRTAPRPSSALNNALNNIDLISLLSIITYRIGLISQPIFNHNHLSK